MAHAVELGAAVAAGVRLDAGGAQTRDIRLAGVDGDHPLAAGRERERRRHPRAGESEHEMGPGRDGRARLHSVWCRLFWYSVKPIALNTAAMIQKRRMIFVSDQPRSSKW